MSSNQGLLTNRVSGLRNAVYCIFFTISIIVMRFPPLRRMAQAIAKSGRPQRQVRWLRKPKGLGPSIYDSDTFLAFLNVSQRILHSILSLQNVIESGGRRPYQRLRMDAIRRNRCPLAGCKPMPYRRIPMNVTLCPKVTNRAAGFACKLKQRQTAANLSLALALSSDTRHLLKIKN